MKHILITIALAVLLQGCKEEQLTLVWSDDFSNSDQLDSQKWSVVTGDGCPELCGFGNNELQYYTKHKDNIWIEDGKLYIQATHDSIGENEYRSAKILTKEKGDWKYGKVEIRAKLPTGRGTWPAIWMLPTMQESMQWPRDGEIDIMEHVGYSPGWVHGTIHTEKNNGLIGTQKSDSVFVDNFNDGFNTYSIIWDEEVIRWMVNDNIFNTVKRNEVDGLWPFDKPFHLIINLAIGGTWGGRYGVDNSIWPQQLVIDYVNIYKFN